MKKALWLLLLCPLFITSCKDELAESVDAEMKIKAKKTENPTTPTLKVDKRKDRDWEIMVGG